MTSGACMAAASGERCPAQVRFFPRRPAGRFSFGDLALSPGSAAWSKRFSAAALYPFGPADFGRRFWLAFIFVAGGG